MGNNFGAVIFLLISNVHVHICNDDTESNEVAFEPQFLSSKMGCDIDEISPSCFSKNDINIASNSSIDQEVNDIVQRQYLMLPYPPFTERDLRNEEEYYQLPNNDSPLLFSYLIQLEYINHYLFRGQNNFS